MANFSNLPNEMISQVWGYILEPRDLESFALVSKRVYAIGRPFVEEHNELRKAFSFLQTDVRTRRYHPAFLLNEIMLRPRTALYVTHLAIGRNAPHWQHQRDDNDDNVSSVEWPNDGHVPYPDDVLALCVEAIQKSSFVPPDQVAEWISSVKEGNEDPILAVISLLLPNLTTITVEDDGWGHPCVLDTMRSVAEAQDTTILTRLVTAELVFPFVGDMSISGLYWFVTLASLPLLQSIHVDHMCTTYEQNYTIDPMYLSSRISNITELTFVRSGLRPHFLSQLLEGIIGLEIFSYVEPDEPFWPFEPFEPFWIRDDLLNYAKHSLQSLKILPPQADEHVPLGSLREFTSLKQLETDVRLLSDLDELNKLANLLPASLEKLDLDTCDMEASRSIRIVPNLVEGIVKAKSKLIPHLESLKLRVKMEKGTTLGDWSCTEPLMDMCRNVGIELTLAAS